MRFSVLFSLIFILVLLLGCIQTQGTQTSNTAKAPNSTVNSDEPNTKINNQEEIVVKIKDFVFDPEEIKIKAGTTIKWVNEDSSPHLVASDPHPTHTDLPGLQSNMLSQGDEYKFTFIKQGTFGYHCHLHPSIKGTITVE